MARTQKTKSKRVDAPVQVEAAPDIVTAPAKVPTSKIATLVALMRRSEGAEIEEMMTATGWQAHSVRGAISGSVKKRLGLEVTSVKEVDVRVYRIAPGVDA
jgi:hypothetical protein